MSFPTKTKIPVAVNSYSKIDLSSKHMTTADFMQFTVSKCILLAPKQGMKHYRHEIFSRLSPLAVPTMDNGEIRTKYFFVPWRTIFPAFQDFIDDLPHVYSDGSSAMVHFLPNTNNNVIAEAFLDPRLSTVVTGLNNASPIATAYDFQFDTGAGGITYRKFTPVGRTAYKLLLSLGYGVHFNGLDTEPTDLGALLAVARIFVDWFYPSQYANDVDSSWIISKLKFDDNPSGSVLIFSSEEIARLLCILSYITYDIDAFTSAWDKPYAPNQGLSSQYVINDINTVNTASLGRQVISTPDSATQGGDKAPLLIGGQNGTVSNLQSVSQFSLDALKSLTDYLKRNQISGSRNIDRYLARYGIMLQSSKLNRSEFITSFSQPLQIGDVTATADSGVSSPLGALAGKGLSYGDGSFSYDADEHGFLIGITTIHPDYAYYQGVASHTLKLTKTDLFLPEFDALAVQPLSCKEVYCPHDVVDDPSYSQAYNDKIFGFWPKNADYKVPYNQLTGDFRCRSLRTGQDSWYLFRDLRPFIGDNLSDFHHDFNFIIGSDASQYNRIFHDTSSNADKFILIHRFYIDCVFPGKSLFDTYEFKDEDKSDNVTLPVNGTQMN